MRYVKIALLVLAVLLGLLAKTFYDQSKAAEDALAETKRFGEEIRHELKKNQDALRLLQAETEPPARLPDVKITYRRERGAERPKSQEQQAK